VEPVQLRQVVEDAVFLLRPLLSRVGVAVTDNVPDGLPAVRADHARIAHVVFVYLGGACQGLADDQHRRVSITAEQRADGWQALEVRGGTPDAGRRRWARPRGQWGAALLQHPDLDIVRRIGADYRARVDVNPEHHAGPRFRFLFPPQVVVQQETSAAVSL